MVKIVSLSCFKVYHRKKKRKHSKRSLTFSCCIPPNLSSSKGAKNFSRTLSSCFQTTPTEVVSQHAALRVSRAGWQS